MIFIEKPSIFMSIQDSGRFGFLRYGLPESGPMDWWAFRAANHLVGNSSKHACLEIGFSSARLRISKGTLMAICGSGFNLFLDGKSVPLWMSFYAHRGAQLAFEKTQGGNWIYLAVAGGILSEERMGSRSVNARARLGQMAGEGDCFAFANDEPQHRLNAGCFYRESDKPNYCQNPSVSVIPGPHLQRFTEESQNNFWRFAYTLSSRSDRMGYRLRGSALKHSGAADLISQGMVIGEIQVPSDGQPIVMMSDHPTTGGYTCIGTVCRVDLPLVVQAQPEISQIKFVKISVDDAQEKLLAVNQKIDSIQRSNEDLWMSL